LNPVAAKASDYIKLKLNEHAEKRGNRAAGHEFKMSESNVRYRRKQKDALLNTNKSRKAF
jgi:hypothetical protein